MMLSPLAAEVKMPALFSDHMVLQRQMALPVWGWADEGEAITVEIAGQTKKAIGNKEGKWQIKLDHIAAEGPHTMTIKASNTITIQDVLVGEVWLASGQSNMAMTVGASNDAKKEIASAKFPQIRTFLVPRKPAEAPQEQCKGSWVVCSPETATAFSAAAYFFGREIHQSLKVPVGLINSSYGGTPIEAWTSMTAQENKPDLELVFQPWKKKLSVPYDPDAAYKQYEKQLAAWNIAEAKRLAEGKRAGYPPQKPVHPRQHQQYPGNLFNGMIEPLIPYAIRGCIWYQGENNCTPGFAPLYAKQLPLLIQDWRSRWNQGDFPFAWVQLPYYKKKVAQPNPNSQWAEMRESMRKSLATPNTGMIISIDTGDENNVHPMDKQPIGARFALWAKAKVYGQAIPYSGPLIETHQIEKNRIVLSFQHTHGSLVAKGGELKGFTIAGADKKWHWAKAKIDGEKVIVSSPDVPAPQAVRYGWADRPECNLYNSAGLPASPFRTDAW
jgi:sialate O-acetylesterase